MVIEAMGPLGEVADATKFAGDPTVAPFAGELVETPAKLSVGTARHSSKSDLIFSNGQPFKVESLPANPTSSCLLLSDLTEASTLVK